MSGWQHRLGVIVPSLNTVMEHELQCMGAGVLSVHTMRISSESEGNEPEDRQRHLLWMETRLPEAAALLAHASVDIICYGCTGGGVLKGPGHDGTICAQIETNTGIKATTTSLSLTRALEAFGARRISVATPYTPWLNDKVRDYLQGSGFEVLAIQGLSTRAHAAVTPERVAELALSVDRPESEAVLISCTNFRTLEIIEPLEARLGKPVVTSNSASMWQMLRLLSDPRVIPGAGRLFREA